MEVTGAANAFV